MMSELNALETKYRELLTELEGFKDLDPDLFNQKSISLGTDEFSFALFVEGATLEAKEATDRWTDNIFTIQSYCVNSFGVSRPEFSQQFGIAEDFDYV